MAAILKFFKWDLLLNCKSDWAKLDGRHLSNIEIQNCQNCSVPISKMATMAVILKLFKQQLLPNRKSDWAKTWWEASERHRDSELLKSFLWLSKAAIFKFFSPNLLPNHKSDWAKTWWDAWEWHRDSELLKLFCLPIQDGCLGGHLENL